RRVAELLLHGREDAEGLEVIDPPLRRTPPDRVRAPQDVLRAKSAEKLAEQVRRLVGTLEEGNCEGAPDLGVDVFPLPPRNRLHDADEFRDRPSGEVPCGR